MIINNAYSGKLNLLCGVPQGSILGRLLLFSLYINDLPKASRFMTRLFADDTALILSDSNTGPQPGGVARGGGASPEKAFAPPLQKIGYHNT